MTNLRERILWNDDTEGRKKMRLKHSCLGLFFGRPLPSWNVQTVPHTFRNPLLIPFLDACPNAFIACFQRGVTCKGGEISTSSRQHFDGTRFHGFESGFPPFRHHGGRCHESAMNPFLERLQNPLSNGYHRLPRLFLVVHFRNHSPTLPWHHS